MDESWDSLKNDINIGQSTREKWQQMLDLIAGIFGFPAVLIVRTLPEEYKILAASHSPGNPYKEGCKTLKDEKLFYAPLLESRIEMKIPDTTDVPDWPNFPVAIHGFVSYIGYPLFWPNSDLFGTICAMDTKKRIFTEHEVGLISLAAVSISDSLKAFIDRNRLKNEAELKSFAKAALEESEERFRKIFKLSPSAVMITTAADGRFIDVNDACLKLFGVEKKEILGHCVTEFPMYGDAGERLTVLEKFRRNKTVRNHVSHKWDKRGNELELNVSIDSINIGDELCLISTLYDMTEQKKLERQIKQANERLTLAADAAEIGIWDWNIKDDILQWDENMMRLYGLEAGAGVDYCLWVNCLHPDDRVFCETELNEALLGKRPYTHHFRIMRPDGTVRVLQTYGQVLRDKDGVPVRLLGVNYDVTEKVHAQMQLEASEARLRRAQQMARVGNWEFHPDKGMFWASMEGLDMYGLKYNSLFVDAKAIQGAVLSEDRLMMDMALHNLIAGKAPYDVQFRIKRQDNGDTRILHSVAELGGRTEDGAVIVKGVVQDITDYVRAEERLIDSERRYKALFEETAAVHLVADMLTGNIVAANAAASAFYGWSAGQLCYMNVTDLNGLPIHDAIEILRLAYEGKKSYYETRHKLADGEIRNVAVFSGPITLDGRKSVYYVIHDISDRKLAEEKLLASEARYRNLFHNNSAVQIILDIETGCIVDANKAACEYHGYTLDEIREKKIWDLNPAGETEIRKYIEESLHKVTNYSIAAHRRYDGEIRNMEIYCVKVNLDGRHLIHAILHDITDRKQAEQALAESEQRFRLFVENAPDGVFVQTRERFAYVNKKTLEMFGTDSEDDLIGRNVLESFAGGYREAIKERIRILNEEGLRVPATEEAIERLDGRELEVEVSAVPFCYQGDNGALVFMRDISERKRLKREKELIEAQLQQKQKLEAIGTLAGGVAHEINNPVTGIINYAQLMLESPAADQGIRDYCGEIIHEGQRIAEIVSSLLKFARQEKKTHSPAQINDIVMGTLSLTRTILRHDQILLEVDIPEGLPSIKCRSQQIQQVLMNLITNARDALNVKYKSYSDNKKIMIKCRMFEKDSRRWLRLTVEDKGTGIPAEVMDKIFDPFFTTKPRDEGTGLGLSISHGIVREHHGELYFETMPGEFTRAIMELPVDNGWNI